MSVLFTIHICATWAMIGIVWLVQLLHYPSFRYIDPTRTLEFEKFHCRNISFIVVPAMLIELCTGVALYATTLLGDDPFFVCSLLILLCCWISTFVIVVPIHNALERNWNSANVERLIRSNLFRTLSWTLRGLLVSTVA